MARKAEVSGKLSRSVATRSAPTRGKKLAPKLADKGERLTQGTDQHETYIAVVGARKIKFPKHVYCEPEMIPFWQEIIGARPRIAWQDFPHLVTVAAQLAWVCWKMDQLQRLMDGPQEYWEGRAAWELAEHMKTYVKFVEQYSRVLQQHGRHAVELDAFNIRRREILFKQVEKDNDEELDLEAPPQPETPQGVDEDLLA